MVVNLKKKKIILICVTQVLIILNLNELLACTIVFSLYIFLYFEYNVFLVTSRQCDGFVAIVT